MTTKQFMEQIMAQNTQILENLDSLNKRVTTLESGKLSTAKTSSKKSTTSTKKKSAPKEAPKQTREERLTEKFGDKESRTKWAKAKSEGFQTIHEVMGHEEYYGLKKNERVELASKFADLRVASPKKSAKTIAKEVLK